MFAIAEIQGKQYKVTPQRWIYVEHMRGKQVGEEVTISEVLLLVKDEEENEVWIGTPYLENVQLKSEVLEHVKGDKIIVFKKKRRKGYKVKKGVRPRFTKLMIKEIVVKD